MEKVTTVNVYPGIGDILWVFQKLQGIYPILDINISEAGIKRSQKFVQMIDGVRNVKYKSFKRPQIARQTVKNVDLRELEGQTFFLEANTWLETGHRIEDWMSKTPGFNKEVKLNKSDNFKTVNSLVAGPKKNIGIYTSSIHNNKINKILPKHWIEYVAGIYKLYDRPRIIIIGAPYDNDMAIKLKIGLKKHGITCKSTIGLPIDETISLIKRLDLLVGFPSGIGILANMYKVPTVMFMTQRLRKMHLTWVDKELIANKKCFHIQFNNHKNLVNTVSQLNLD